jgi:propanol-preferring alcohol dehydrogenase
MLADHRYCFPIDPKIDAAAAAPLLCAGLIGYRALRFAGDGARLGLYGFGAAAHILAQVARHQGRQVFAFTSPGDSVAQDFARKLGAVWAGSSTEAPPEPLDAAILFAPVGTLVPVALAALDAGGTLSVAGIHLTDIPPLNYQRHLFRERTLRSVTANTRDDGRRFLDLAGRHHLHVTTTPYPLGQADRALADLAGDRVEGAAVLVPEASPAAPVTDRSSPGAPVTGETR